MCRDKEVTYGSKGRHKIVKHCLFSSLFAVTLATLPIHTNKRNTQMYTSTGEFHSSFPVCCGLVQRIFPWMLGKSQNEKSDQTFFLFCWYPQHSWAFEPDLKVVLAKVCQNSLFLMEERNQCWGNTWWRTKITTSMEDKRWRNPQNLSPSQINASPTQPDPQKLGEFLVRNY